MKMEPRTITSVQPRAVVLKPAYLRPEAKITNVMAGRIQESGARDEKYAPTKTAGTDPMMMEPVTAKLTVPNASAPKAAATVSGTACARSVPTSRLALSIG